MARTKKQIQEQKEINEIMSGADKQPAQSSIWSTIDIILAMATIIMTVVLGAVVAFRVF